MITTVIQESVVQSQPIISVSFVSPVYHKAIDGVSGGVKLNAYRIYFGRKDPITGFNCKIKRCDGDGLIFNTIEEAKAEAMKRGYIRPYYNRKVVQ